MFPDYYGVEQYVEKPDIIELDGKEGTLKTEWIETSSEFNKIAKRIGSGTMSISSVEEYYCLNDSVRKALEKLIRKQRKKKMTNKEEKKKKDVKDINEINIEKRWRLFQKWLPYYLKQADELDKKIRDIGKSNGKGKKKLEWFRCSDE